MSNICAESLCVLFITSFIASVLTKQANDVSSRKFIDPNLHPSHYPYFFRSHPEIAEDCRQDDSCPYKADVDQPNCWGYEEGCHPDNYPSFPVCTQFTRGRAKDIESQQQLFWTQADFGFAKNTKESMKVICQPQTEDDSLLECNEHIRHCRVKNLYLDLTNLHSKSNKNRFSVEAFSKPGAVGGHCKLDREYLKSQESQHFLNLRSWYGELNEYTETKFKPVKHKRKCDVIITRPSIFMKFDAGVNMYHHFCDFFNLYISQHINGSFSQDINIIMWDTVSLRYGDLFFETWSAFTDTHFVPLKEWEGKKVCIADGVFSLPPRIPLGLYYSTPIPPHCHGSAMMRAFSQHVLHRLGVTQQGPKKDTIRITLIDRQAKHRNIINQNELVADLKKIDGVEINAVVYNKRNMTFIEQLQNTHNSDILIGMHGAGLTHLLFLPDWAVVFEIFNCDDRNCYKDLASIRGVNYITWENNDLLKKHNEITDPTARKAHAKFCDYEFDVPEFTRLVRIAISRVKHHKLFTQHHEKDEL